MEPSTAEMNYLSAIHRLSEEGEKVSTSMLANEFGIAAASVTDMIQKLADKEYIRYEKYKGVSLLPVGIKIAEGSAKNDDLWLRFMQEMLHMTKEEQAEALEEFRKVQSTTVIQQLEHFLETRQFEQRIAEIQPEQQIHPLPQMKELPDSSQPVHSGERKITTGQKALVLSEATVGHNYTVLGVNELTQDLQEILNHYQFPLGAEMKVVQRYQFDQTLKIKIEQKERIISLSIAEVLRVKPI